MKRYQILSAVVLAMAMTACVHEENFSKVDLQDGDFAFSLNKISTKSTATEAEASRSFKLGDSGFYLEESVSSLDEQTVDTKGTPIYTENIEKYYPTINVVGYKVGGDTPFVPAANFEFHSKSDNGARKVYAHHYASDFWPEEGDEQNLWFFLKAPQAYLDETTKDMTYGTSDGSFEFDYSSPLEGENQKDILFTSRTLTKAEYFDSPNYHGQGGAPVTFYHALTAVKFRTGHENDGTTHTIITHVKITGLNATGHCKVAYADEGTSKSADLVDWPTDKLGTNGVTFDLEFKNPDYTYTKDEDGKKTATSEDGTYSYTADDGYGDTWTSAAADKNLNDADGTKTFWFIPQQLNSKVVMEVTFLVKTPDTPNGQEITHTINLGDEARVKNSDGTYGAYPTWKAGELRTYTLKPFDVDVTIIDEMKGLQKSNLHITNTGNVNEFVRMMLVGNWYDEDGNILVGYKYSGNPDVDVIEEGDDADTMVSPWFRGDPTWNQYFDETFANGLPNAAKGNKWVYGTGSYFYWPDKIGAGVELNSSTEALFQTYTLPEEVIPTIYVPSATSKYRTPAKGVHLVMEVVIQAIGTTDPSTGKEYEDSGTDDTQPNQKAWQKAWTNVTGKDIVRKTE